MSELHMTNIYSGDLVSSSRVNDPKMNFVKQRLYTTSSPHAAPLYSTNTIEIASIPISGETFSHDAKNHTFNPYTTNQSHAIHNVHQTMNDQQEPPRVVQDSTSNTSCLLQQQQQQHHFDMHEIAKESKAQQQQRRRSSLQFKQGIPPDYNNTRRHDAAMFGHSETKTVSSSLCKNNNNNGTMEWMKRMLHYPCFLAVFVGILIIVVLVLLHPSFVMKKRNHPLEVSGINLLFIVSLGVVGGILSYVLPYLIIILVKTRREKKCRSALSVV